VKFSAPDCSFELELLGYQFAASVSGYEDRNWLQVRIAAMHNGAPWNAMGPVLLTSEVAELANWLDAVADGKLVEDSTDFIEPNLQFELLEPPPRLRIYFELEFRPKWMVSDGAPMSDFWCEFPMVPEELHSAAVSLRSQLSKYPPR
jgi:hypothetical protein